jgi:hypothetical protein
MGIGACPGPDPGFAGVTLQATFCELLPFESPEIPTHPTQGSCGPQGLRTPHRRPGIKSQSHVLPAGRCALPRCLTGPPAFPFSAGNRWFHAHFPPLLPDIAILKKAPPALPGSQRMGPRLQKEIPPENGPTYNNFLQYVKKNFTKADKYNGKSRFRLLNKNICWLI